MADHRCTVVADDLTGGLDTGSQFAARGYETTLALAGGDGGVEGDGEVLVWNTDSRYADADDARERVGVALDAAGGETVYKKIDSTLRGNVGTELAGVFDATDPDVAVVAPAFPSNRRTTVGGTQLVEGVPAAESAAGRDPDAGASASHLPTLLAGAVDDVRVVPVETVATGAAAVRERLRAAAAAPDRTAVVCDAVRESHLRDVAAAASELDAAVAYVGTAGLARYVDVAGGDPGATLGVVGSVSDTALDQLAAVPEEDMVGLDPATAATDPDAAAAAAALAARDRLAEGDRAVLTAARTPADVTAALAAGRDAGLDESAVRDRVAGALATAASAVQSTGTVDALFLTGGAVAARVLGELDADAVELTGREVAPGVPLGTITAGSADGTPVVTKAGDFGDRRTIVNSLDYLADE